MESKNLIIIIESIVLVAFIGFLIYGYNQYSVLNKNHNDLNNLYNNLKTEFNSFTDFGTSKVKLPIDNDYEALTIALNSVNYNQFMEALKYQNKELPELMYHVIYVPPSVVNHARQKESYNWIPTDVEALYIIKVVEKVPNKDTFSEFVFNLYINPKNGDIIKGVREKFYEGLT